MGPWGVAAGLGVLMRLVPFVVAFVAFPVRDAARAVFESIMAVTVPGTAVALGLAYLRRRAGGRAPVVFPSERYLLSAVLAVTNAHAGRADTTLYALAARLARDGGET